MPPWQHWSFSTYGEVKNLLLLLTLQWVESPGEPLCMCCVSHHAGLLAWGLALVTASHPMQQPAPLLDSQLEFVDLNLCHFTPRSNMAWCRIGVLLGAMFVFGM